MLAIRPRTYLNNRLIRDGIAIVVNGWHSSSAGKTDMRDERFVDG